MIESSIEGCSSVVVIPVTFQTPPSCSKRFSVVALIAFGPV